MRTWLLDAAPQYGEWREGMLSLRAALSEIALQGLDDDAVAVALNARTVTRRVDVPARTVRSVLRRTGDLGKLVLMSRKAPTGDAQTDKLIAMSIVAADTILDITGVIGSDDESVAVFNEIASAFAAAGIFTQDTKARLLALGEQAFPVWDPPVTAEDVATARRL